MGQTGCSETSVKNHHDVPRNISVEGRSHDEYGTLFFLKNIGQSPAHLLWSPVSIPRQSVWDLRWKDMQWDSLFVAAPLFWSVSIIPLKVNSSYRGEGTETENLRKSKALSEVYVHWIGKYGQFLGAFAKLWKATISFFICPSVRMEQLGSQRTDFLDILYLWIFSEICQEYSSFIKIRQE